ncbi:acyltransferase family protein [Macrococcus lamae]|uniref:Probable poly-beta-1,6-N-acetyl-D-glucosamine export protein n=1 Tax=Macrococcus lamae TaxID=198484 RepID=A0A4R6BV33_9STAP|nr:acyltransferase family protein [Macrococcus lamae]TDM12131.1 poly-beta-1,6-N-acetyl-D-glucosamine export protein [Macrococcus lamae]
MSVKPRRIELNYLRVFLCMLIITTHILTEYAVSNEPDDFQIKVLYWIRMIVIVGTPGFIILSQLLVTLNYKETLPRNYLISRVQFILLPYLVMGMFYSYSESEDRNISFMSQFYENIILGNWYGYFVIVIMQFYLLNYLIYKINPAILGSKLALILSIIVNAVYLYAYEFVEPVKTFMDAHYPISFNTFILGWISYYFIGSYIGLNYDAILEFLEKHLTLLLVGTVLSFLLFIFGREHDYWNVTSYNFATILYTACLFLLLIKFSTIFKTFMANTVAQVSAYSFFIYLLHPIILDAIFSYTQRFQGHTLIFIPITLLIVIGCCIGIGSVLKEFPIFKYVMGKQPYRL